MSIEGELSVTIARTGGCVDRVSIRSTRPAAIARLLVHRSTRDAAALVPRLFAVCADAQGAASAEALDAACGRSEPGRRAPRELAVALESCIEDLWRLLVDLPPLAGGKADVGALALARRTRASLTQSRSDNDATSRGEATASAVAALESIATERVLGERPEAFLARVGASALGEWAAGATTAMAGLARTLLDAGPRAGACEVRALGRIDRALVARLLLPALARDQGFARAPDLEGEPRETGAIDNATNHAALASAIAADGNSLATRLFARLVQLATSIAALRSGAAPSRIDAWSPADGEGLAVVRTARGLLVHHARVDADRVRGYAILAPTEWNFHPRGAVARGLRTLTAANDEALANGANLLVALADPCVRCTVDFADA